MTQEGKKNNSRWTDNPFRQPGLSKEQIEWLDKRDEATRIFQETGDDSMAIEIGLFAPHDEEDEEGADEELAEGGADLNKALDLVKEVRRIVHGE